MRRQKETLQDGTEEFDRIQKNIKQEKQELRRYKRKRFFRRSLAVIFILALAFGLYQYDKSNFSRIQEVKVSGSVSYSTDEIREILGLETGNRIYLKNASLLSQRLNQLPGIVKAKVNVYYTKGLVSIQIEESPMLAYLSGADIKLYYQDLSFRNLNAGAAYRLVGIPILLGFADSEIPQELLENLAKVDRATRTSISEIHYVGDSYQEIQLKLVMDHHYYVFTNTDSLPLLNNYATIISEADPQKRCITLINDADQAVAIVRACE